MIGRLERYAASAERLFYKALRELTKQNEAKLVAAVQKNQKKMIDRIAYGPPPNHPRPENRPAPVQNESKCASPPPNRPSASDH